MSKRITSVEGLTPYLGKVVRVSTDNGRTWKLGRIRHTSLITFTPGHSPGYMCDLEVINKLHYCMGLTEKRFKDGLLVEPASDEEAKGKKFSYGN